MDPIGLNLPSILTDAEIVFYGGVVAVMTAIVQTLSWIPIPEGSRARAWIIVVLSALFVGLSAGPAGYTGANLVLALILSWSALSAASLGLNRAGSYTVAVATDRAEKPAVTDYDPKNPGAAG